MVNRGLEKLTYLVRIPRSFFSEQFLIRGELLQIFLKKQLTGLERSDAMQVKQPLGCFEADNLKPHFKTFCLS